MTNQTYKVCNDRLFLWEDGTTPTVTEIPLTSITPNNEKGMQTLFLNSNVDSNGALHGVGYSTSVMKTLEVMTARLKDGAATPALLAVLATIEDLGEKTSPDDYAYFIVSIDGGDTYKQQFAVSNVRGWGGEANAPAEFAFTLTEAGLPAAYATELPARAEV